MLRVATFLVMLLAATITQADEPLHLYVATGGNDAWSGRLESANPQRTDGPFATLERARQEVRRLKTDGRLGKGVTILVRDGVYALTKALSLGPEDSGSKDAPIVYRAYPGETPTLIGARRITGFRPSADNIYACSLQGTELEGVIFRQLFFHGRRMVMARYPNGDRNDPHFGTWAHTLAPTTKGVKDHLLCTDDVVKNWTNVAYAEVCIHPAYGWAWRTIPIKSVDRRQARITLLYKTPYEIRVGDRYFVQNLRTELDAPEEWYLDRDTWTLYFWPPSDLKEADVLAPVAKSVIVMKGAHYITLRGFTIEGCAGDAVRIQNSEHCRVAGCTIRNCGGWGVNIAGGQHCGAVGNDVFATGAGGIRLYGGDRKTLARGENYANNNYIHHVAALRRTYHGGILMGGVGNTASHNLIHDCYHQGIGLGGNDNVVEYNIVHHTNLGSEDTGGLYMSSRDYTMRGNVIRYNIFHHVGGFGKANAWSPVTDGRVKYEYPHFAWGIYLDAPETGVHVYGNVLYSLPLCALFQHGGKDTTWENNIVIDAPAFRASVAGWASQKGGKAVFETSSSMIRQAKKDGIFDQYLARYPELARYQESAPLDTAMFNSRFIRNIVYYTKDGGRWLRARQRKAWDDGQLVWTYTGQQDDFPEFEFDRNTIFAPPEIEPKFALTLERGPAKRKLLSWQQWRATGNDQHSIFADPLFVDPANHDYRLRPDSPALKLGFKPIPIDEIGPHDDPLRATWPIVEAPGAAALGEFTTTRYFQLPDR